LARIIKLVYRIVKPTLVPATPGDSEFRFQLYASTRTEEVSIFGWDERQQAAFMRMQFLAREQSYASAYPRKAVSLILCEDLPVGAMMVDRGEHEITLIDIALLPEFRSRGIGTSLIQDLINEAHTTNKPLQLQVAKGNRAAALYSRLGFARTGENKMYEQMKINANTRRAIPA
jgi:ribosomal protein S18 acetylase RimI-like enzyme